MHEDPLTDDSTFARLVDDLARELETQGPIDWAKYDANWPQYASELRKMAPALEAMVKLGPASRKRHSDNSELTGDLGALGDFRLIREIGRGGMGIVYEAEQISLGRRVALKLLPFAAMMDERQLQRFKNEARTAATLAHPHIVSVYSVGCERGLHYFAMQYVEGRSLAEIVAELRRAELADEKPRGTATRSSSSDPTGSVATLGTAEGGIGQRYFRRIARLGIEAARALDHAHQCGVVHRDIKPSNLLLDNEGKLWVADFGLASTAREADLTMTGDLIGTLRYMSPEQIRGERAVVDHRTDVYSLGVTLYELLTLRKAYSTGDRHELLSQVVTMEPERMRKVRATIPADLETIINTAMHKDAVSRYQTADALAADLERFLDNLPIKARPARAWESVAKWARRSPAWAALIVVCMMACAAIMGMQFWYGVQLGSALAQTEKLRLAGLEREGELLSQLYPADVFQAWERISNGDVSLGRELLLKHAYETEGLPGVCGPEWEYLVRPTNEVQPVWRRQMHAVQTLAIAVAPDGSQVASLDAMGMLKVWDPKDGGVRHAMQAHVGEGRALAYSPDGQRLYSSGQDRQIKVFETRTWEIWKVCPEAHTRNIYALALNKDGSRLLSAGRDDGGIRLWDTSDMQVKLEIAPPLGTYDVTFSPDEGQIISVHVQNTICRWNASDGQLIQQEHCGGDSNLQALAVAEELSTIFAAGYASTIFSLDAKSGKQGQAWHSPAGVFSMSWSPKRRTMLMGCNGGFISCWRFGEAGPSRLRAGWRRGHAAQVSGIAWLPDQAHFVTACRDGSVALWKADQIPLDCAHTFPSGKGKPTGLTLSADGRSLITGSLGPAVQITDVRTGERKVTLEGRSPSTRLHFANDDRLVVGGLGGALRIWDASSGRVVAKRHFQPGEVVDVAISPDQKSAAAAIGTSDKTGTIAIVDSLPGPKLTLEFECIDRPTRVEYSPDGKKLLVAHADKGTELIDLASAGKLRENLEYSSTQLHSFSTSGRTLAFASSLHWHAYLFDMQTQQVRKFLALFGRRSIAQDLAWSPDERLLAISINVEHMELWHVPTARRLFMIPPLQAGGKVRFVRFSSDGQSLIGALEEPDAQGNTAVVQIPLGDQAAAQMRQVE